MPYIEASELCETRKARLPSPSDKDDLEAMVGQEIVWMNSPGDRLNCTAYNAYTPGSPGEIPCSDNHFFYCLKGPCPFQYVEAPSGVCYRPGFNMPYIEASELCETRKARLPGPSDINDLEAMVGQETVWMNSPGDRLNCTAYNAYTPGSPGEIPCSDNHFFYCLKGPCPFQYVEAPSGVCYRPGFNMPYIEASELCETRKARLPGPSDINDLEAMVGSQIVWMNSPGEGINCTAYNAPTPGSVGEIPCSDDHFFYCLKGDPEPCSSCPHIKFHGTTVGPVYSDHLSYCD